MGSMLEIEFLSKAMNEAASEVFTTMLNQPATSHEPVVRPSIEMRDDGILSLIGITGDWVGSGALSCSATCARWMSAQMLLTEFDDVSDEVLDAVGEVTNMIIGNFKNLLSDKTGPLAMSVPAVVYGTRMRTNSRGGKDWVSFPFSCQGNTLDLLVQLQPKKS